MRKIFENCENQIFQNEVNEKLYSLRIGKLSTTLASEIFECWNKVLDKPLYEKVISRFKYDRFNYYAVQAYREHFFQRNCWNKVSASDVSMFEKAKYSDDSLYCFFLKEPLFGAFYVKSVLVFRDMLDDKDDDDSEFGSRTNKSSADSNAVSNSDADVYTDSLDKLIWGLNHRGLKTADQVKNNVDTQTADQLKSDADKSTAKEADDKTDEQKDIEELAKKLSEFVHLYNTAFDKFKRLKG